MVVHPVAGTAEEMAFEMDSDYSHLNFRKVKKFAPNLVELDNDVAAFFKNATAVNKALRMFMEAMPGQKNLKRKKSA